LKGAERQRRRDTGAVSNAVGLAIAVAFGDENAPKTINALLE
jgi:hypothetical protein